LTFNPSLTIYPIGTSLSLLLRIGRSLSGLQLLSRHREECLSIRWSVGWYIAW